MDLKENLSKVNLPKVNLKAPDLSKINFRKFNWTTVLALLSYLYVLAVFPLIFSKDKPFVHFHARQGIALIFVWVLFLFSFYVPLLPYIFAGYLTVAIIWGIIMTVTGRERPIPLIGKFAANFKL